MKEVKNMYAVSALNYMSGKTETSFWLAGSFQEALSNAQTNFLQQNYQMIIKAVSMMAEDVNY